jgi:VIT1/CCC1 family predicted Fe2+/Mn2+ transporter
MEISKPKPLLNAMDRVSEILFGIIMTLTFTCSIGIANAKNTEIRQLIIAAISCNIAWGLVDAISYIVSTIMQRSRNRTVLDSVLTTSDADKARKYISDSLPPSIASVLGAADLEQIRSKLAKLPDSALQVRLTTRDLKRSLMIFFLMFISTLPIVTPFIFIHDTNTALRTSNLIAIIMMFFCGWSLAKYVGINKWILSITMTFIGIILVFITIVLGG